MKSKDFETLNGWRNDPIKLKSSYRRLVRAHLPVNIYSARAQVQRRAAALLHGIDETSSLWEEFDGLHLADDERGDRTSFLLGGTAGGVALPSQPRRGLLAVGDPYPRMVNCRIIVGTLRPLTEMARDLLVEWRLADALGHIALRAEDIIGVLGAEEFYRTHPGNLAAAS